MNARARIAGIVGALTLLGVGTLRAQVENHPQPPPDISAHGRIDISGHDHRIQGEEGGYSGALARLSLSATVSITDVFRMPVDMFVTTSGEDRGGSAFRIGVHPQLFGWLTLHGGRHRAALSPLTLDGLSLDGVGMELKPGRFRASVFYGGMGGAVEPDSAAGKPGIYERRTIGFKIGYGNDRHGYVDLNVARFHDDSTSLAWRSPLLPARDNAVASIACFVPLFDAALHVRGEFALAAFTADVGAPSVEDGAAIEPLFEPRYSTRIDGASTITVSVAPVREFSLALNGRLIGPGYRTLGNPYLENDLAEATIVPSLTLFDGKARFDGSFGLRFNNLRDQRTATTQRVLASVIASVAPWDVFGVTFSYMNYGLRSALDSLGFASETQSFSIAPRLLFEALGASGTAMLSYAHDRARIGIGETMDISYAHTATALGTLSFPSGFSYTLFASRTSSVHTSLSSLITAVGQTVGYRFFDGDLTPSLTVDYDVSRSPAVGERLRLALDATYAPGAWGTLRLRLAIGAYRGAEREQDISRIEQWGSLGYSLGF